MEYLLKASHALPVEGWLKQPSPLAECSQQRVSHDHIQPGYARLGAFHFSVSLTVSSWESGTGTDLGPGAWGKLLNGAKALGLKNWRTKEHYQLNFQ